MIGRPNFEELVFFQEVKTQCISALFALEQVDQKLDELQQSPKPGGTRLPNSEVFRALHSFLTHCANISRLLFPGQRRNNQTRRRGKMLCDALDVDENSPIADRSLRDHLEHYDERLDRWARRASKSATVSFATDNIHPKGMGANVRPESTFRTYLTDSKEFFFMGHTYELVPLATEVRKILETVLKVPGVR